MSLPLVVAKALKDAIRGIPAGGEYTHNRRFKLLGNKTHSYCPLFNECIASLPDSNIPCKKEKQ